MRRLLCVHRGPVIHREPCRCSSKRKINVYSCKLHKRCVLTIRRQTKIRDPDVRLAVTVCQCCADKTLDNPPIVPIQ